MRITMKRTTAEQEVSLGLHLCYLVMNVLACNHARSYKFQWFTFNRYGGQFKHLSHMLLYFHTFYCAYAVVVDILSIFQGYTSKPADSEDEELKDSRPIFVQIRDELFNTVCFPIAFGHTLVYALATWLNNGYFVSMINRRKEELSAPFMLYIHVVPLFSVLLESMMVYRKYAKTTRSLKVSMILATAFVGWLLWVAYFGSYWSYPFLRRSSALVRSACLVSYPIITGGCYLLGKKITQYIWISDVGKVKAN